MVRFCECGEDMFICQECGRDLCSKGCNINDNGWHDEWIEGKGNVCRQCIAYKYIKLDGKWQRKIRTEPVKGLKGNPAYDLMM